MHTSFVAERSNLSVPPGAVDRKRGIVRGVRVVNEKSRNGRVYPAAVLAKHAALYGNVGVNIGHHYDPKTMMPVEVPPHNRFGRLENARANDGGINADLRFNVEHKFAKPFLWAVENDPAQYSFSPLHRVQWQRGRDAEGNLVAEAILDVASVDIVSDGGTTSTIFESRRFTREGKLMIPEVDSIVSQLETPGTAVGWLTDFWKALAAKFQGAELDSIKIVLGGLVNAPVSADATGQTSGLSDAIAALEPTAAESRRIKALVDRCPFDPPRKPVIQPGKSIADLVSSFNP